jgi:peptide/nickel transport system substrate-binding protein
MGPIPELGSNPVLYAQLPRATGPYRIARYTPGKSLILIRNPQWDPDTDPGRHAYPNRYVFHFAVPAKRIANTILSDSRRGRTSVAYPAPTSQDFISGSVYLQARNSDRLTVGPGPCTFLLSPDYRKIPDIRVRKAIGYAYPYKDAEAAAGGIDALTWIPGTSILPPGVPGRQDFNPLSTRPGSTDPDKARALLKQAGYAPREYVLRWFYNQSDAASVASTQVITRAFRAAGFNAKPTPVLATYMTAATAAPDPTTPFNLRIGGWCADWPSGSNWFTETFRTHGGGNYAFFAEPTVDAKMERISQQPLHQQAAQWGALDKTMMTHYYPIIITGYHKTALLHGSHIGGLRVDTNLPMPAWQDLHVIP